MRSQLFFYLIALLIYLYRKVRFHHLFISSYKKEELHDFYTKNFPYFNLLNDKEKKKFVIRIIYINRRNEHNISPHVQNINKEVELLICAAFAQITFGYNDFELEKFNKIIVHPKVFFSRYINHNVKGLTVGSGYIHYSWEDFQKGYKTDSDKINLGLHELAHALYIDRFHESESFEWMLWKTKALSVIETEQETKSPLFRVYGKTNIDEFWAVTIEYFFEDPITFRTQYQSLYDATANILKQDMAERKSLNNNANVNYKSTITV